MTVMFVLDQSRSNNVPRKHFGESARGIINCDRFSAYGKLAALIKGLVRSLCWSHFRRDFVDAGKSINALKAWADLWVSRIAGIYRLNDERLAVLDKPELFSITILATRHCQALRSDIKINSPAGYLPRHRIFRRSLEGGAKGFMDRLERRAPGSKSSSGYRQLPLSDPALGVMQTPRLKDPVSLR
jgi:hypothetical protein